MVVETVTNADRDQRSLTIDVVRRERLADGTVGPATVVGAPRKAVSDFWARVPLKAGPTPPSSPAASTATRCARWTPTRTR